MTFAFFLPDPIPSAHLWIDAITTWLAEAHYAGGEAVGLILLLVVSGLIPAAVWWVVYRTLLVWLRARPDSGPRRR